MPENGELYYGKNDSEKWHNLSQYGKKNDDTYKLTHKIGRKYRRALSCIMKKQNIKQNVANNIKNGTGKYLTKGHKIVNKMTLICNNK